MEIVSRRARAVVARVLVLVCKACVGLIVVAALSGPAAASADGWEWPVQGRVITSYANDNSHPYAGGMHRGIDIAAPIGTNVVGARSGEVTFAAPLGSSGLTVAVRTSDGRYATSYLHLASIAVRAGTSVDAGQTIGTVGTTGVRSAEEPHLHFGVRVAGAEHSYLDPLALLPPLPGPGSGAPPAAPETAPVGADQAPVPVAALPVAASPDLHPRHRLHTPVNRFGRPAVVAAPAAAARQGVLAPLPLAATVPSSASVADTRVVRHSMGRPAQARAVPAGPTIERSPAIRAGKAAIPAAHPHSLATPAHGEDWGRWVLWTGVALVALAIAARGRSRLVILEAIQRAAFLLRRATASVRRVSQRRDALPRRPLTSWNERARVRIQDCLSR